MGDAKVARNDSGDARQRPEFIAKAVSARPLTQKVDQVAALLGTAFRVTAPRKGFGVESRLRMLRHGITPAPDGVGGGFDMSGHVPDAPAGRQQGDSGATSHFELNGCAFRSHEALIGRRDLGDSKDQ
jgi:hypothetical protein